MKPPSYADPHQRLAFADWLEGKRVQTKTPKSTLAAALGQDSTHHVNLFLTGKILPLPQTLQIMCDVMDLPWFEAFATAGYYRQILLLLCDLVSLAKAWGEQDLIDPVLGDERFLHTGVLRIGGKHAHQALQDHDFAKRYLIGEYTRGAETIVASIVPKPLAVALLVGTAGFPRRGDVYKDGRSTYAAEVLTASRDIARLAHRADDSHELPLLLKCADAVLKNTSVPFGLRRVAAAEYVVQWCDRQCVPFTHYARLAVFDYWGEAGSSVSTLTPYVQMPQIRIARCPDLNVFAT
jgi:hypothetical protein